MVWILENPLDTDGDNTYEIFVNALGSRGGMTTQLVTYTVTEAGENSAPVFDLDNTALGDLNNPIFEGPENTAGVLFTVSARDSNEGDVLTYSLLGGDARFFDIDSATGEISARNPDGLDFENSQSLRRDNFYQLTVTATDTSGATAGQPVNYRVTDLVDNLLELPGPREDYTIRLIFDNDGDRKQ